MKNMKNIITIILIPLIFLSIFRETQAQTPAPTNTPAPTMSCAVIPASTSATRNNTYTNRMYDGNYETFWSESGYTGSLTISATAGKGISSIQMDILSTSYFPAVISIYDSTNNNWLQTVTVTSGGLLTISGLGGVNSIRIDFTTATVGVTELRICEISPTNSSREWQTAGLKEFLDTALPQDTIICPGFLFYDLAHRLSPMINFIEDEIIGTPRGDGRAKAELYASFISAIWIYFSLFLDLDAGLASIAFLPPFYFFILFIKMMVSLIRWIKQAIPYFG